MFVILLMSELLNVFLAVLYILNYGHKSHSCSCVHDFFFMHKLYIFQRNLFISLTLLPSIWFIPACDYWNPHWKPHNFYWVLIPWWHLQPPAMTYYDRGSRRSRSDVVAWIQDERIGTILYQKISATIRKRFINRNMLHNLEWQWGLYNNTQWRFATDEFLSRLSTFLTQNVSNIERTSHQLYSFNPVMIVKLISL